MKLHLVSHTQKSYRCAWSPLLRLQDRDRPGIAAVEFALVMAFILCPVFLAMCELSRGMMVKDILSDSARRGCRTGIQRTNGNSQIIADATKIISDNNIPTGNVQVTITLAVPSTITPQNPMGTPPTDSNNNPITDAQYAPPGTALFVQVSVPVSDVMWVSSYFLSSSSLVSETMVMMKQ